MGTHNSAGFTIIETTLFLAISGLLVIALMVGTGASLNVQRYRDASESLKSLLQQQYSDITSVQNGRDNNWACGADALPNTTGARQDRGQTDCMLLGKYVRIQGQNISTYRVIGYKSNSTEQTNDIALLLNNYRLNTSPDVEKETSTLEWGTKISWPTTAMTGSPSSPGPSVPREFGMLVVRSPDSGQIYTFTTNDVPDTEAAINSAVFSAMIAPANQDRQLICISPSSFAETGDRAVYIKSFASSSSAIELISNEYMQTISLGSKC